MFKCCLYLSNENVCDFCVLPWCLPAGRVGSLSPLEHISCYQGVTPASQPASWVHLVQTLSSESIYWEVLRLGSQTGFWGNQEGRSRDCSCPQSQQIKQLSGVEPSRCQASTGHPEKLSPIFHPGHPWPEAHTSPRSFPGSSSPTRGSLYLPLCHSLKGWIENQ